MQYISILGDSISTFSGKNPPGYSVYYDRRMQSANSLYFAGKTWWGRVIKALGGKLCVNNSYSGSRVCGADHVSGCSEERTGGLHTPSHRPDVILIYMGFNDFGYGMTPDYAEGDERMAFDSAYKRMLDSVRRHYPEAKIIGGTVMRSFLRGDDDWIFPESFCGTELERYNEVIRRVCREENCLLADLSALGKLYETLDGVHPTAEGHKTIAEAWIESLAGLGFDIAVK